jgi:diaminopimelate decarboxylase
MTDNPRYTLYQAEHTFLLANRMSAPVDFKATIAGRCCESGDVLKERAWIPKPEVGDNIATLVTGAYNYSMASNYNRLPRPPVVMLTEEGSYLAVRRETLEDLVALDQ